MEHLDVRPRELERRVRGEGEVSFDDGMGKGRGGLDAQVKLSTDSPCLTKVTITGAISCSGSIWVRARREGERSEVE